MDSANFKKPNTSLIELTDAELDAAAGGIVVVPLGQPGYGNATASTFANGKASTFQARENSHTTQVVPGLGQATAASHGSDP